MKIRIEVDDSTIEQEVIVRCQKLDEELLPRTFLRISKSAIVNTNKIYSIHRNLTASSLIAFQHTHKQIYVSRAYYKLLKNKLDEKRLGK